MFTTVYSIEIWHEKKEFVFEITQDDGRPYSMCIREYKGYATVDNSWWRCKYLYTGCLSSIRTYKTWNYRSLQIFIKIFGDLSI